MRLLAHLRFLTRGNRGDKIPGGQKVLEDGTGSALHLRRATAHPLGGHDLGLSQ
jgi:hypothetical protein